MPYSLLPSLPWPSSFGTNRTLGGAVSRRHGDDVPISSGNSDPRLLRDSSTEGTRGKASSPGRRRFLHLLLRRPDLSQNRLRAPRNYGEQNAARGTLPESNSRNGSVQRRAVRREGFLHYNEGVAGSNPPSSTRVIRLGRRETPKQEQRAGRTPTRQHGLRGGTAGARHKAPGGRSWRRVD